MGVLGYGLLYLVPLCGTIARERQPPGRLFFLLPTKERTKENCRCCDAADPRLRGCTPLRTPKRKSEGAGAKRTQYYCPFLTLPPLPPPLSRVFPRTPAGVNGCSVGAAYMPPATYRGNPSTGKREGCRPPLPLSSAPHLGQSVGAGHARPSTLPVPPLCLLHCREGS